MAESADESFAGCFGFIVLAVTGWILFTQGPVAWYVAGAVAGYFAFLPLCRWADREKERVGLLRERIVSSVLDDGRKILRNLAIALSLVLIIQIVLNLFANHSDPTMVGTNEQRLWDFLARLTSFGSLKVAALITLAAIILSALIGNVLPVVLSAKARKLVSTTAALLASVMMFSFVTEGTATRNFTEAIGPIRAQLISRLEETAKARQEAAAYSWIAATMEAKQRATPAQLTRISRYFREGERICDRFESVYQRGDVVRTSFGSMREVPDDRLCDKPKLVHAMTRGLVRATAAAEVPPISSQPWLSDFADNLVAAPADAADPFGLDLKLGHLADLQVLSAKITKAASDAEAARGVLRGLATKSIAKVIGGAFVFDGAIGEVVDALRDAALTELAKRSEGKVRKTLAFLAQQRPGSIADAATWLHETAFPEQPLPLEGFASDARAAEAAKSAWAELHPSAKTMEEVRVIAAAAIAAKVTGRMTARMAATNVGEGFRMHPNRPTAVRPRVIFRR